jgi:hypothetical protein
MAVETQQVAQNSSTVAPNPATGSTGASGGTAGSNTTQGSTSGGTPTSTAVVAPKRFRQDLQQMLQGWQTVVPSDATGSQGCEGESNAAAARNDGKEGESLRQSRDDAVRRVGAAGGARFSAGGDGGGQHGAGRTHGERSQSTGEVSG